ncbi:MAG: hypothetical protein GWP39_02105 [Planctomycetia bacterium]|jgi:hypothetical protein|nr:hypothetical protein [Planctomycetia bacterium]NCG13862.1 hypothetical protein [Planctomycetia bacterium]NCG55467.1 hypothetical protein [Pseudomonadota bacterium]
MTKFLYPPRFLKRWLTLLLVISSGALWAGESPLCLGVNSSSFSILDDELDAAIEAEFERVEREEKQVRYRGQYRALKNLGPGVAPKLLDLVLRENPAQERRRQAANALVDVATVDLVGQIEAAFKNDLLMESWVEVELTLLLARLGERKRVDRWISSLQRKSAKTPNTATLPSILSSLILLSDLQYRSGLYLEAVGTHLQRIELLKDIASKVRPELRPNLLDEVFSIHYNLACCYALLGNLEAGLGALETSLNSTTIDLDMARIDGDLKALRAAQEWPDWLKRAESRDKPEEVLEKVEGEK